MVYILMCNRITRVLRESLVETEETQVEMDGLVPNSNEDYSHNPRLKFLCSFNGSILPRPQDGKLRYVGGETRIVSVPRDIRFDQLMMKMKKLFEGATVLKYQQPDEDLDALVSVVNDDDVTNMMEEYDKLGSGDGFTRLRILLFSNPEQDDSVHFDVNERDNERRYVDALNSLNDSPEFGKQPVNEFQMAPAEDIPATEHYFNHLNIDSSFGDHRNFEMPRPPVNFNHMESPWSPAYYSPRHPGNDFPASPSYSPYPEDFPVNHQPPENVVLLPPAPISGEPGFPANMIQNPAIFDGNSVCEHCHPPNDPRSFYNEAHSREPRSYNSHGGRRLSDHYIVDNSNNGMNLGLGPTPYHDDYHVPSHYGHHDDRGGRYGNFPYAYGHVANTYWRNVQNLVHRSPSYEASSLPQQESDICNLRFIRTRMEPNPSSRVRVDNQNQNQNQNPGFDVAGVSDYSLIPNSYNLENQHHAPPEPVQFTTPQSQNCSNHIDLDEKVLSLKTLKTESTFVDEKVLSLKKLKTESRNGGNSTEMARKVEEKDGCEANLEGPSGFSFSGREQQNRSSLKSNEGISLNCLPAEKIIRAECSQEDNTRDSPKKDEFEVKCLSYVPEYIESIKNAALEDDEEVKGKAQEKAVDDDKVREETGLELDAVDANVDLEVDSDGETESNLKIEPTKAEEEAIAKGLQTIKNDDLEEIREVGSGTYGAVYHGKWKGSDVAIKRIKASCFAGKPSERERSIAEFWREALILSSLHHPNVVSFYGIVRDGPDGSLVTVTEFMVNGSLKQFLKKKDRTIDRRKRLIIAMDAAFGMEYLHGKNIVHFDLKCENLLVNMRDPHRPICKIGDLGLSKVKQHTLVSGGVRGTLPWMAPELLSGKSHMVTEKIDVYSFGIVMWELLTGDEPYGDMHCASIIGGIVNNSLRPTIPTWCDPEWKSLMGNCWSAEPTQRPSFSEISQKLRTMAAAINVK